jgi:DNA-directed RNA polymerase subunit RPC12/RpoP
MKDFNRDYGLPNSSPTSAPKAEPIEDQDGLVCPNCGCAQLMKVTVEADQKLLKGGKGIGTYIGCPACPFASPMMIVASESITT